MHPTRVISSTSSIIDHIYTSNPALFHHNGVLDPGLSDHGLVFVTRKHVRTSKEKETLYIRDYRFFDEILFASEVASADWDDVYSAGTVDEAVASFNFIFISLVNCHLPWRKIRSRIVRSPWITSEFLSLVEYYARKYRRTRTPELLALKQECIRNCNRLKCELKRDYVQKSLNLHRDNPCKLWQCIRTFWPNGKNSTTFAGLGGNTSNFMKAKKLNQHFSTVVDKLGSNLLEVDLDSLNLEMNPPIFDLREISHQDVSDAISMLSNSQAFNDDGITSFMLKCACTELLKPLCFIFNMSLNTACFPSLW